MTNRIQVILLPLLIINYVLGSRIMEFPVGKPRPWISIPYILLLWTVYYFCLSYIVITYVRNYSYLHDIYYRLTIIPTLFGIIFGMYYDKKFRNCFKKLDMVDETLEMIGITMNYQERCKRIQLIVLTWLISVLLLIYGHSFWYTARHSCAKAFYICFLLEFTSAVNFARDLLFGSILRYIGLKFDQINDQLRKMGGENTGHVPQHPVLLSRQSKCQKACSSECVTWLVIHLHLELCKIAREINLLIGPEITTKMACYFAFISLQFYELFNMILHKNYIDRTALFAVLISGSLIMYFLRLFLINYVCESVCNKANSVGDFISNISYSTHDVVVHENISQLLLHLNQAPLKFYGLRLFQFGLKFFRKFVKSVTTVIVIMIQSHIDVKCSQ